VLEVGHPFFSLGVVDKLDLGLIMVRNTSWEPEHGEQLDERGTDRDCTKSNIDNCRRWACDMWQPPFVM